MNFTIAAFYKFFPFADYISWRKTLRDLVQANDIKGIILLAPEGINSTVAGSKQAIEALLAKLSTHPQLQDLEIKFSEAEENPFTRCKVRLKKEIITFGHAINPRRATGQHVAPAEWNGIISDPETLVLDTRNHYEVEKGTFERAVNPNIQNFSDLAGYIESELDPEKHPKVATFCTGGIRCEKLTSYLLQKGFKEVYQLKGGILKYLEEVPESQSLWQGECFVFDGREGVSHGVKPVQKTDS